MDIHRFVIRPPHLIEELLGLIDLLLVALRRVDEFLPVDAVLENEHMNQGHLLAHLRALDGPKRPQPCVI